MKSLAERLLESFDDDQVLLTEELYNEYAWVYEKGAKLIGLFWDYDSGMICWDYGHKVLILTHNNPELEFLKFMYVARKRY